MHRLNKSLKQNWVDKGQAKHESCPQLCRYILFNLTGFVGKCLPIFQGIFYICTYKLDLLLADLSTKRPVPSLLNEPGQI